jgi:hypothetical protein
VYIMPLVTDGSCSKVAPVREERAWADMVWSC